MRIIINVKYRKGSVHLETRMDQSSTDKVAEINAGQALLDNLNATFAELGNGTAVKQEVSPFEMLVRQIESMRDRAKKDAEEEEATMSFETAHRCRSVEGTLNELLRLSEAFNTGRD